MNSNWHPGNISNKGLNVQHILYNQEAVQEAEKENEDSPRNKSKKSKNKAAETKSLVGRLLSQGTEAKDARGELFNEAAKQHSKTQKYKQQKVLQHSIQSELAKSLEGDESKKDAATLSQAATKLKKETQKNQTATQQLGQELLMQDEESGLETRRQQTHKDVKKTTLKSQQKFQAQLKNELKEFGTQLSKYISSDNPHHKQKALKIKQKLMERGMHKTQIKTIEQKVSQSVKAHHVYHIKKKLLTHFFSESENTFEKTMSQVSFRQTADRLEAARSKGQIQTPLHDLMAKLGEELRQELNGFLFDEASRMFAETQVGEKSMEDYKNDLSKLQKIAAASGIIINEEELTKRIQNSIEEIGLEEFVAPENPNASLGSQTQSGQQDQTQSQTNPFINQEEVLEDKLRNLYMLKSLSPNFKDRMGIEFKMKRLKNGLVKLGINVDDRMEGIQKEGEFLAKIKLTGQLKNALREQATLVKLSGPEYKVIKQKKAFALKHLRKLGSRLSKKHISKLQDEVNREIFAITREEFNQIATMLEVRHDIARYRNYKTLESILKRLKKESNINQPLRIEGGTGPNYENRQVIEAA